MVVGHEADAEAAPVGDQSEGGGKHQHPWGGEQPPPDPPQGIYAVIRTSP
jgi:hypothetical protein